MDYRILSSWVSLEETETPNNSVIEFVDEEHTEDQYQAYLRHTEDTLRLMISKGLDAFESVINTKTRLNGIFSKTSSLREACLRMACENEILEAQSRQHDEQFKRYSEITRIKSWVSNISTSSISFIFSDKFLEVLSSLDSALVYINNNPNLNVNLSSVSDLRQQVLALVIHRFSLILHSTVIQQAESESSFNKNFVTFKNIASESQALFSFIDTNKEKSDEYKRTSMRLQQLYIQKRSDLLLPALDSSFKSLLNKNSAVEAMRGSCALLIQLCSLEHSLFEEFFSTSNSSSLNDYIGSISTKFLSFIRPVVIREPSVNVLCDAALLLKGEVLNEQISFRGDFLAPLAMAVSKTLADVRERLLYRLRGDIREKISNFDIYSFEQYHTSFPPLNTILESLSIVYSCMNREIFAAFAPDVISICISKLIETSKLISHNSTVLFGQLFLIRNLLILSEKLSPFDELNHTERILDFSNVRDVISGIIRGKLSLSSLIIEHTVDSKDNVQNELSIACQCFIRDQTMCISGFLVDFLNAVANFSSATDISTALTQIGITKEQLIELVHRVSTEIPSALQPLQNHLHQYLNNLESEEILMTPILTNIRQATNQLIAFTCEYFPNHQEILADLIEV